MKNTRKTMKIFFLAVGVLLGFQGTAQDLSHLENAKKNNGAAQPKEINILFVGNSFTYRHDLSKLVKQVFEEGQPNLKVNVEQVIYGGQDLFRHHDLYFSQTALRMNSITIPEIEENIAVIESMLTMEKPPAFFTAYWKRANINSNHKNKLWSGQRNYLKRALKTQNMISQRIKNNKRVQWDYVVLQSWLDIVPDVNAGYGEYAQKWAKLAEQEGIKVILYITAPHAQNKEPVLEPIGLERTDMQIKTIQQLAERIKPYAVVPVGLGIKNIQLGGSNLKFRYVNDAHPNQYSAFLTANMFYAAFFKESTEGFTFNTVVENTSKGKGVGKDPDGGEAKVIFEYSNKTLLQKSAYDAVMEFYAGYGE
jgi:hypothetical protein